MRTLFPISTLQVDGKDTDVGSESDAQQKHEGLITQFVGGIPGNQITCLELLLKNEIGIYIGLCQNFIIVSSLQQDPTVLFSTIFALMKMLTEPSRLITSKILFLEQDVTLPPYFTLIQIMSELIGLWRRRVPRTSAVASKT